MTIVNNTNPNTFNLVFEGSISDAQRQFIPHCSGVYLVYKGVWSEKAQLFFCREILYIGQAVDVNARLANHEYRDRFIAQCRYGEIVFYSYASVAVDSLDIIESALIFHTKPRLNTLMTDAFPYSSTRVLSSGACALLDTDIIIGGYL